MNESHTATAYYLDERLSLAETTRQLSSNTLGSDTSQEGFYVLAIRRSGYRDCVFRFSARDRSVARPILESLNRSPGTAEARP
jgi:hypothetical protein